jgi:hypothetical protein
MQDVIGFVIVIGAIALCVIAVRFATAFTKRLEARPPGVASPDPAIGELRDAVDALQERVDFLERALVVVKNQSGRTLPSKGERADSTPSTPS